MSTSPLRTIHCAQCQKALYQTDGLRILTMNPGEMSARSITITVHNELITCCSRVCLARWILGQPDSRFGSGRSLGW